MHKCLMMMYRTALIYGGAITQENDVITVKIPQHLKMEDNSFYMVYRIHISEEKLLVKDNE